MRRLLVICILSSLFLVNNLLIAGCNPSQSGQCETISMPLITSVEAYLKKRAELPKTPFSGATLLMHAWLLRQYDKATADKLLILSLHESRVDKSPNGVYKGYKWRNSEDYMVKQIDQRPYCARSYVIGAAPANGYKINKSKIKIKFRVQTRYVGSIKSGKYKVFVCTSGAQSCRPVPMGRNSKGIWKARGLSSIAVGCIKPVTKNSAEDDL
ncbi:hypothetical protein MNBD_GAMMA12-1994 [hydrothermal vent metagenome]|uniref:DUF6935 domain-containing protein n=1 Tax=hydrothermal vent metagenome TaxID=652676 RepID=A0A3B0Z2T1_9ZZZZ